MTRRDHDLRLVRFLVRHALLGIACGWTFLTLMLATDLFGLGGLIGRSEHGWLALILLAFGFAVTFGSAAMGTAVFLFDRDEDGHEES